MSSSVEPKKKSRLIDAILHPSPLQSKGESEDGGSDDSNRPPAEATPLGVPQLAVPLRVVHPGLDLEFSTAQESEDEGNVEVVNIVVDSPVARLFRAEPLPPAKKPKFLPRNPPKPYPRLGSRRPPPGRKEVAAETPAVHRIAVASSFAMLILKLQLRNSVRSPLLCGSVELVKSLHFESRDR